VQAGNTSQCLRMGGRNRGEASPGGSQLTEKPSTENPPSACDARARGDGARSARARGDRDRDTVGWRPFRDYDVNTIVRSEATKIRRHKGTQATYMSVLDAAVQHCPGSSTDPLDRLRCPRLLQHAGGQHFDSHLLLAHLGP